MIEDCGGLEGYREHEGSLLDLTFGDHRQRRANLAAATNSQITLHPGGRTYLHEHHELYDPVEAPLIERRDPSDPASYDWEACAQTQFSGPDGRGQDAFIKDPQLISALTEVVEGFVSLRVFKWNTRMMAMPLGVVQALAEPASLTSLHTDVTLVRNNMHNCELSTCSFDTVALHSDHLSLSPCNTAVPYWNLTSKLESIAFSPEAPLDWSPLGFMCDSQSSSGELFETDLTSYDLLTLQPSDVDDHDHWEERYEVNCSVIRRTIIAAARTGHLRRLQVHDGLHHPFAVRTLLPCWVDMKLTGDHWLESWQGAARMLRPCLSHASLWIGTAASSAERQDRLLNKLEVQALRSALEDEGVPRIVGAQWEGDTPINKYLPWLEEDFIIAQQVAAAWNVVVVRGDAGAVRCNCDRCEARWLLVQA